MLCSSHIPHCWKSHALALLQPSDDSISPDAVEEMLLAEYNMLFDLLIKSEHFI